MENYFVIEKKLRQAFKSFADKEKITGKESYALHYILRDMYLYALEEGSKNPLPEDFFKRSPRNFI